MRAFPGSTAMLATSLAATLSAPLGAQVVDRTATGGRFVVDIATPGIPPVGYLKRVEGGYAYGDVVTEARRGDVAGGKHLANVRWAPIAMQVSPASNALLLKAGLDGTPLDGRLLFGDINGKTTGGVDFKQASVTRIAFPSLDGASKDACYVEVALTPGQAALIGESSTSIYGKVGQKQVPMLRSNFRVQIPGLPTNRVSSVDSIVMTRAIVATPVGAMRDAAARPGDWELRNVTLTIAEADYAPFAQWYDDFVIKGNRGPANEKTLDIVLLGSDLRTELLTLHATGVGVVALRRQPAIANEDSIVRFELELYVEKWEIVPGSGNHA